MKTKLFKYQKEGVECIEDFEGRVLLADEMGLGKTIQTLVALKRNPEWLPALVVCPATLKCVWQHEATHHIRMQSSLCEGQKPPSIAQNGFTKLSPLTIINYDILMYWVKYLKKLNFKSIVFDETQYLINRSSKRSKASKMIAKTCSQVFALSGTPLTNRPSELWPILNILWPEQYKSFWSYAQKYCNPRYTHWGWDFSGATNLDELHKNLLTQGMIRRRKADVLKDLPSKVRRIVPCELSDQQEYQDANLDFLGWLKRRAAHKVRKASRAQAVTRIGYLLRLCARLKIRSVVDWSNRFFAETDEKLILFAIHKKAIDVLKRRIKVPSVVIDGSVRNKDRQLAVDQFQKDPRTRLFIGQLQAAAFGITLTAASEVGFVELGWRPGDHVQAEDRPHRIGQTKPVFINYFVAAGTIEEKLCKILQAKQEVISSVLDGGSTNEDIDIYRELLKIVEGGLM